MKTLRDLRRIWRYGVEHDDLFSLLLVIVCVAMLTVCVVAVLVYVLVFTLIVLLAT